MKRLDVEHFNSVVSAVAERNARANPVGFRSDDIRREKEYLYFRGLIEVIDALLIYGNDQGSTIALTRLGALLGTDVRKIQQGLDGAKTPVSPVSLDVPIRRKTDARDLENYTGAEGWIDTSKAGALS